MDLKSTTISGAKWTTLSTIINAVIQLLRLSILARFLNKEDFGIVAILLFVFGLVETFSDFGFATAIMHKKDINERQFNSLFWIQAIVIFLFFIIASACSSLAASFYNLDNLTSLLPLTLSGLLLLGIGKLYETVLQKEMQFKLLAIRNIVASFASLIIATFLAYWGYGVYSLIFSMLCQLFISNIWNFVVGQKSFKVSFVISLAEVIPLVKIGLYQMGAQFVDYLSSRLDIIIIGRVLGIETLGIYNLAKELLLKVLSVINGIANRVALPIFAYIQEDLEQMRVNYCRLIKIISLCSFPFVVAIGGLSPLVTELMYGDNYMEVAPIMKILSIAFLLTCVINPVGNIITALGKTDIAFCFTLIRLACSCIIVYSSALYGLIWLAWGQVGLSIIAFVTSWYMELKLVINLNFFEYTKSFILPYIISIAFISIGFVLVTGNIWNISGVVTETLIYGALVLVPYIMLLFLLRRRTIIQFIRNNK